MKKASEYRLHAKECLQLAAKMDAAEQREQLIQMASYWEKMAQDRALLISKHPELAIEGEPDEEKTARRGAEFSQ